MEQLFAPWRIEWVERSSSETDDRCPFCTLPERDADRKHRIVARSEHAFVLLNNAPYSPGHAMVIPYEHGGELRALADDVLLDCAKLKARTIDALDATYDPDGFNAGENLGGDAAGGSIDDHVHTHVVPRWRGDTNFMPVIGDAKVIVEALEDSYDRLHDAFAEQSGADVGDGAVRFDLLDGR